MQQPHQLMSPASSGAQASPFRKIFVPWRLFAGLGLVVLGVVILAAIFLFVHRISLRTLAIGPVFVLLGGGLMVSARARGCAACKNPLDDTSTVFPLEMTPHVQQAVSWAAQGNVDALLNLQNVSLENTPRMAAVLIDYCPSCRNVAELSNATNVRLPDGTSIQEGISPRVAVVGPVVGRVLDMVGHRNTAMTHAMYGGPLPQ
jgi:hypothetical protein